ncbi:MAG: thioesterase family protein [Muribaculaceae bacterium]|nr:thioesterase family protein [Alistipes senegalensis]MCM1474128.1 thioesterase family protein [Muribaculaceae bacterium]
MKNIQTEISGTAEITISENELAVNVGSGSLNVFATPCMAALMEKSACDCLSDYMEDDETTVGTELNIKHVSATPVGMKVTAEAVLTEINGREFIFSVKAYDETGLIGEGTHKRFLVKSEKFIQKTYSKIK